MVLIRDSTDEAERDVAAIVAVFAANTIVQ
jgi:hypothetical protein